MYKSTQISSRKQVMMSDSTIESKQQSSFSHQNQKTDNGSEISLEAASYARSSAPGKKALTLTTKLNKAAR